MKTKLLGWLVLLFTLSAGIWHFWQSHRLEERLAVWAGLDQLAHVTSLFTSECGKSPTTSSELSQFLDARKEIYRGPELSKILTEGEVVFSNDETEPLKCDISVVFDGSTYRVKLSKDTTSISRITHGP